MLFKDIQGHENIKCRLRDMVDSDRIPHALLLEGSAGTGKFKLARALAQYIHCEARHDGEPCGCCPSCRQHMSLNHIDTYYSYPVVKRKGGGVTVSEDYAGEWRRFLTENPYMDFNHWLTLIDSINAKPVIYVDESDEISRRISFTTRNSSRRIIIIWLPERMNVECANKLLKMIEEPYPGSLFIMVSNEPNKILPTIYSRTQRVQVQRLSDETVVKALCAEDGLDRSVARNIAILARGDMNNAHRQLSAAGNQVEFMKHFVSLMRLAYQRQVAELKQWSIDVAALGREQELSFMAYCQRMIRENFIYNLNTPSLVNMNDDELKFSSRFARFITHANVTRMYDAFEQAAVDIAANGNSKIILFDLAVKTIMHIR